MKNLNISKSRNGFTIVELLIVIVVIAILAAITIVAYNGIQNRANDTTVQSDLRQTYTKVQEFAVVNGRYPQLQTEINQTFTATRKAHGGGNNTYLYCRSDAAVAVVGRSVSTNGFYYSSVGGAKQMSSWPGESNVNLCPAAGIPTTSSGYVATWIRVNGAWESWFTPGA